MLQLNIYNRYYRQNHQRMNIILNNISTDALKDLIRLLSEFKTVFAFIQT